MAISLDNQQATSILTEGLARGLYEPSLPQDEKVRLKDASDLVEVAMTAARNGNKSDNVKTVLFIANVDMNGNQVAEIDKFVSTENGNSAQAPAEKVVAENVADGNTVIYETRKDEASSFHNGIDLASLSAGVLEGLIIGLDNYPLSEQVEIDRKAFIGEKERRANAPTQKAQEIAPPAPEGAPAEKAGEIAPEVSAPADEGAGQRAEESEGSNTGADSADGGTGRPVGSTDEDAGTFARAQTPETQPEAKGKAGKAKSVSNESAADRAKVESELNLQIVRAHAVDITKLDTIPIEQLEFMIANPDGPPEAKEEKVVSEGDVKSVTSTVINNPIAVGVVDVEAPTQIVSKAELGLEAEEANDGSVGGLSAEREKLESLVTGPMLKCYRRGRKDIPTIGDNELRLMVENPTGKISPEELEKARALDNGSTDADEPQDNHGGADQIVEAPEHTPQIEIEQDKDRSITQAAAESVSKPQPVRAPEQISQPVQYTKMVLNKETGEITEKSVDDLSSVVEKIVTESFGDNDIGKLQQQNRAMEIIQRENMPIPPAYSDEDAPVFPMDVSKCSRDDLFSLHARFHAYETRMSWILMQREDELNDCIKLRSYREAVVAKEMPFMGEDGKRNTNEFRDALVRGDQEVLDLGKEEHEKNKIVTDLKVLQKIYHLDCERLSRQMSKYEREIIDAPR